MGERRSPGGGTKTNDTVHLGRAWHSGGLRKGCASRAFLAELPSGFSGERGCSMEGGGSRPRPPRMAPPGAGVAASAPAGPASPGRGCGIDGPGGPQLRALRWEQRQHVSGRGGGRGRPSAPPRSPAAPHPRELGCAGRPGLRRRGCSGCGWSGGAESAARCAGGGGPGGGAGRCRRRESPPPPESGSSPGLGEQRRLGLAAASPPARRAAGVEDGGGPGPRHTGPVRAGAWAARAPERETTEERAGAREGARARRRRGRPSGGGAAAPAEPWTVAPEPPPPRASPAEPRRAPGARRALRRARSAGAAARPIRRGSPRPRERSRLLPGAAAGSLS